MNKFKQSIYTVILLLTCFVASPFIYKQIWKSSMTKKPKVDAKPPIVTSPKKDDTQPTSVSSSTDDYVPALNTNVSSSETASEPVTEAQQPVFTQSGPEYFDDALFIGDSRTVGLRDYGTLKNAEYACDIGLATYQISNAGYVWSPLNSKQYGKIYIMLGINEVGNDVETTMTYFRKFISDVRSLQPNAIIFIEANLHVTTASQDNLISNASIDALNSRMAELADGNSVFYLDVNSVFDDGTGALTSDYTGDGRHLYASHYSTWCDWLCANTVVKGNTPAPTAAQSATQAATVQSTESRPQNETFSNQ